MKLFKKNWILSLLLLSIAVLGFWYWLYTRPFFDPVAQIYEDVVLDPSKTPIIKFEIPVGKISDYHEFDFSLTLRRDYGVSTYLTVDEGYPIADPNSNISGTVKVISESNDPVLTASLTKEYGVTYQLKDLMVLSHKDINGINNPAKIVLENLKLSKSEALKSKKHEELDILGYTKPEPPDIENLKLVILVYPKSTFFH